jgi:hypothetical protein
MLASKGTTSFFIKTDQNSQKPKMTPQILNIVEPPENWGALLKPTPVPSLEMYFIQKLCPCPFLNSSLLYHPPQPPSKYAYIYSKPLI